MYIKVLEIVQKFAVKYSKLIDLDSSSHILPMEKMNNSGLYKW